MNAPSTLTVDVRPTLRAGGEPFADIMAAVAGLAQGQSLRLLATFKPAPLFAVMASRGFNHEEREIGGGDWEVLFRLKATEGAAGPSARPANDAGPLDTRGLEPPEPMVRVLHTLETMPPGSTLEVYTDREPLFLYKELAARGHSVDSKALGQAGYRHLIRRSGPAGAAP
jgi:uncharacterized protein (DUF2249 family)